MKQILMFMLPDEIPVLKETEQFDIENYIKNKM